LLFGIVAVPLHIQNESISKILLISQHLVTL
jgi:hypothetical protein